MHPKVYRKFEELISLHQIRGRVLEIGAAPNRKSLLASRFLNASIEKIGLNIRGPKEFEDFKILKGNSNNMEMFSDESFDCVLSNATLEHDKFFWKSIYEMKRVLKRDGLLIIGAPSFRRYPVDKIFKFLPGQNFISDFLKGSTFCLTIHGAPGDYYRFSEQIFKEFFFEGFYNVGIDTIMIPPRTIGYGLRK